jgi:tetratricopeptide (TPR) repeat protein
VAIDRDKVLTAAQKFVEKKKYDKAVQEYQKLVAEDPNDARTLLKIGDLQSKMEAYPQAIETYERVGKFYATQGFALKAIAVYKQIRELIVKHAPTLEERYGHITPKLAELYQQLGLTSDALAALDEVATRLQRANKDGEAIDVFRKIVELDPTNPLPHLRLAEALSRIKDTEAAVAEFGLAAQQLVRLGRRDDALKVIERLLHHKPDPTHARIAAELYLARNQQNDGMQALAKLQICFQANPKDLDTLALLARAFAAIGQAAKGIEVQKEMAKIAREQGKLDLFKQLVEKLVRAAPNDDGVKQLLLQTRQAEAPPPPPPPPPPQQQASTRREAAVKAPARMPPREDRSVSAHSVPIEDLEYEAVETGDIDPDIDGLDEEPIPLRPSDRPPPVLGGQQQHVPINPRVGRHREPEPLDDGPEVVVGEDQLVAEEYPSGESAQVDVGEQLVQILSDAQSFRRVRLYPKAIETLRIGLELEPRSLDVREALRDVLLEAGHIDEAVLEMLDLAALYVDSLDGDAAARCLQDVLAYDPPNARARQMLNELGYEVIDEPQPDAMGEYAPSEPQMASAPQPARGGTYEEPLPAYDLDEVGPEQQPHGYKDHSLTRRDAPAQPRKPEPAAARAKGGMDLDDPFGRDSAPLPSFPLDAGPESEQAFDLVGRNGAPAEPEPYEAEDAAAEEMQRAAARAESMLPAQATPSPELEEALEEAEFFASRGLFDDARNTLLEQLERNPKNPLILDKIAEIDAQEQAKGGSGARQAPASKEADRAFDIAASLDALEQSDRASAGPTGFEEPEQQVDVEEVFAKFKEGVAKQISVDDAQSHYDLGVAYKEMGLLEDAVREFEVAARDPKRECVCRSMIGMIQIERGNLNEAIDAFMRGLKAKVRTPEQETVLEFEVGACYETKKMNAKALEFYLKVQRRDPSYRDVSDRVRRLKGESKAPERKAAVGADDEFDRAFDDLLGGKS